MQMVAYIITVVIVNNSHINAIYDRRIIRL
ncbi:MAG: hypothetical protein QG645_186 [Patescibacteria group bacterium]|nr:hypothetical protein [Patescibacteria group bacterium]